MFEEMEEMFENYNTKMNTEYSKEMFVEIIHSIMDYIQRNCGIVCSKYIIGQKKENKINAEKIIKQIFETSLSIKPQSEWRRVEEPYSLKQSQNGMYFLVSFTYIYNDKEIHGTVYVKIDDFKVVYYKKKFK